MAIFLFGLVVVIDKQGIEPSSVPAATARIRQETPGRL